MMLSSGTLVSDCCHMVVICDEDDIEKYICCGCTKPCNSDGTLGEDYERLEAPKREHQRLKDAVVEASVSLRRAYRLQARGAAGLTDAEWFRVLGQHRRAEHEWRAATDALMEFEQDHK